MQNTDKLDTYGYFSAKTKEKRANKKKEEKNMREKRLKMKLFWNIELADDSAATMQTNCLYQIATTSNILVWILALSLI